jgi:hypothetical protein
MYWKDTAISRRHVPIESVFSVSILPYYVYRLSYQPLVGGSRCRGSLRLIAVDVSTKRNRMKSSVCKVMEPRAAAPRSSLAELQHLPDHIEPMLGGIIVRSATGPAIAAVYGRGITR